MKKKKILVVDDEVSLTRLLKRWLEQTGQYEVSEVNLGAVALAAARELKPDLVLLDVMMPDLAGGDVAAQIRSDEMLRSIPIVFLSAAVLKEEAAARDGIIGGHPVIAKPVNVAEVIACIEKYLGK